MRPMAGAGMINTSSKQVVKSPLKVPKPPSARFAQIAIVFRWRGVSVRNLAAQEDDSRATGKRRCA